MSESQDLNLADLNYTFQTTKTETAATLLKERAGDRRYLASLLRDHAGAPIVSSWQQHRRDDIDDLLDYYSLLEIAAIVGHIPAVFPENLKRQIFPKLRLPSMRLYYEQYYIQKLPTLLRLRLEGRHALAVEPDSTTTAAYAQLADLAASVRGNEEMNDLLALLDDYVIDGRGWQDLEKLLADPKKYVKHVTSNSPDDDILASAAIGFQGFLSFCRDFHELLRQVERQPLVQSAFWHLFSYWFDQLSDEAGNQAELGKMVSRSLDGIAGLAGEIDDAQHRGLAKADLRNLRTIVVDLADRKYARPVEAAIAVAENAQPARKTKRSAKGKPLTIWDLKKVIAEAMPASKKVETEKISVWPTAVHVKQVLERDVAKSATGKQAKRKANG